MGWYSQMMKTLTAKNGFNGDFNAMMTGQSFDAQR